MKIIPEIKSAAENDFNRFSRGCFANIACFSNHLLSQRIHAC